MNSGTLWQYLGFYQSSQLLYIFKETQTVVPIIFSCFIVVFSGRKSLEHVPPSYLELEPFDNLLYGIFVCAFKVKNTRNFLALSLLQFGVTIEISLKMGVWSLFFYSVEQVYVCDVCWFYIMSLILLSLL